MNDTPAQPGSQRLPLPQVGDAPFVPPTPPAPETPAAMVDMSPEQIEKLEKDIIAALCTCFDPEIPVNIYELGLIYDIDIKPAGAVGLRMTLTSPGCPVAGTLPGDVEAKV